MCSRSSAARPSICSRARDAGQSPPHGSAERPRAASICCDDGDALQARSALRHVAGVRLSTRRADRSRGTGQSTWACRCWNEQTVHVPDVRKPISNTASAEVPEPGRLPAPSSRCRCCARAKPIGVFVMREAERGPFTRQADRAGRDLRRPGGDRHRERAAVRGGAGAHRRAERGAAAADRDGRRAQGHQPLGRSICSRCSTRWSRIAARLCEAEHGGHRALIDGDASSMSRRSALRRSSSDSIERQPLELGRGIASRPRCDGAKTIHIPDVAGRPRIRMRRRPRRLAAISATDPRRAAAAGRRR